MADQVFLSLWLRQHAAMNMLRHFEKMLECFPFSKQRPAVLAVRVYALEFSEPPLAEYVFGENQTPRSMLDRIRSAMAADCCCEVEGYWDLWDIEGSWELKPMPVSLFCFAPGFLNDEGDHLRVALGYDGQFLPAPGHPESVRKAQSNLLGLLRFVHQAENALPVANRRLWLESGGNFAELFQERLAGGDDSGNGTPE